MEYILKFGIAMILVIGIANLLYTFQIIDYRTTEVTVVGAIICFGVFVGRKWYKGEH